VEAVVQGYTREAGVRGLTRCLSALCRAAAVHAAAATDALTALPLAAGGPDGAPIQGVNASPVSLVAGPDGVLMVTPELIRKVLGPARYIGNNDLKERGELPGVVAGLSWTAVGGDLMFIEAAVMPGRGELQLTGQLGRAVQVEPGLTVLDFSV
jgi:ATP-dependent Lon protease